MKFCTLGFCDRPLHARGMCHQHYRRWLKKGDPGGPIKEYGRAGCDVEGCTRKHYGNGLCQMHYMRMHLRAKEGDQTPVDEFSPRRHPPHVVEHGRLNEYTNFGCRCELCRAANARYMRERRARRKVAT